MTKEKKAVPPGGRGRKKDPKPLDEKELKIHILKAHHSKKLYIGRVHRPEEDLLSISRVYPVGLSTFADAFGKIDKRFTTIQLNVSEITSIRKQKAKKYLFKKTDDGKKTIEQTPKGNYLLIL